MKLILRRISSTQIILPSTLSIILFVGSIFWTILPALERHLMDRKREMIRQLTETAWSTLARCHEKELSGSLSRAIAQKTAIDLIRSTRYGREMKDYFWINDMQPRMVMHPYRVDLDGQDLTTFADPNGKRLFCAFVDAVKDGGSGYVDYMWQWKDDSNRIVPKLSYVKIFEPWQWIIGTGIYLEDVKTEIASVTRKLTLMSLGILGIIAALSLYIMWRGIEIDTQRKTAERNLKESEGRLKTILNAVQTGVLVIDAHNHTVTDANPAAVRMIGMARNKMIGRVCRDFSKIAKDAEKNSNTPDKTPRKTERHLKRATGGTTPVISTVMPIALKGRKHFLSCFFDITDLKRAEFALKASEEKYRKLFHNAQVGLYKSRISDGIILECNDRFAQMFGFKRATDMKGRSMKGYYLDGRTRRDMLAKLQSKKTLIGLEAQFKDKHEQPFWVQFSVRMDSARKHIEGVGFDITEKKRAEQELKKNLKALSLAREEARTSQRLAEEERDKTELALAEVSASKHRLEVLLADSSAREKRMVELKAEVNLLLQRLEEKPRYEAPQKVQELFPNSLSS